MFSRLFDRYYGFVCAGLLFGFTFVIWLVAARQLDPEFNEYGDWALSVLKSEFSLSDEASVLIVGSVNRGFAAFLLFFIGTYFLLLVIASTLLSILRELRKFGCEGAARPSLQAIPTVANEQGG